MKVLYLVQQCRNPELCASLVSAQILAKVKSFKSVLLRANSWSRCCDAAALLLLLRAVLTHQRKYNSWDDNGDKNRTYTMSFYTWKLEHTQLYYCITKSMSGQTVLWLSVWMPYGRCKTLYSLSLWRFSAIQVKLSKVFHVWNTESCTSRWKWFYPFSLQLTRCHSSTLHVCINLLSLVDFYGWSFASTVWTFSVTACCNSSRFTKDRRVVEFLSWSRKSNISVTMARDEKRK